MVLSGDDLETERQGISWVKRRLLGLLGKYLREVELAFLRQLSDLIPPMRFLVIRLAANCPHFIQRGRYSE